MLDLYRAAIHFAKEDAPLVKEIRASGKLCPLIFWGSVVRLPVINPPPRQPRNSRDKLEIKFRAERGLIDAYDDWCKSNEISRARGLIWLHRRLPELPPLPIGWESGPIAATKGYNQRIGYVPPSGVGIDPKYLPFFSQVWSQPLDSIPRQLPTGLCVAGESAQGPDQDADPISSLPHLCNKAD